VQPFADGVGFHAQANEVVGVEVVQGLFASQRHSFIVREFDGGVQPPQRGDLEVASQL
jgi:hypothetical protein